MTVREYLKENKTKAAYTIRKGNKNYLCNIFEAYAVFGNANIKKICYKYDSEKLPVLTIY